jgi:hypothetical protein
MGPRILILGSGLDAPQAANWRRSVFDHIVVINNAWRVLPYWSHLIHPEDFPADKRPTKVSPSQQIITADDYVAVQNTYGGFIYAGGTMAFTAGYWALGMLRPSVMAFFGCDMMYADQGNTHFYGKGTADPLREDISLRSLEAKSARLALHANAQGCNIVNLSAAPSRQVFPRAKPADIARLQTTPPAASDTAMADIIRAEKSLGYFVASGRYWESSAQFDIDKINRLDALWRAAYLPS